VCARVHDAVRRENPNQFVMTLFSSRASLARRRALRNEISLRAVCVCARVYKRVLNIQGKRACERRSYLLLHPVSSLAAFNLHDMPPASQPARTDKRICFQFAWRAPREVRKVREQESSNEWDRRLEQKRHLEPEFSFCVCHWRNKS
jgi:hypothetical protein